MFSFPEGFFWGAATSAHQVEGNNSNSDWWAWEKRSGLKDLSGQACRHYELYKEDFDLARQLGHNAHRFSLEWSRIEPEEGRFSSAEISHYRDVILALKERNLEPIVTLHHFTNPLWLADLGGWQNKNACRYFSRYAQKVAEELGGLVRYWITINEPLVYVYNAYLAGVWPPQQASVLKAAAVTDNLAASHVKAYRAIHGVYKRKGLPRPYISIAKHLRAIETCAPTFKNKFSAYLRNKFFNFDFIERLLWHKSLDFIGINYYTRDLVDAQGWGIRELTAEVCKKNHRPLKKNFLGWDIYPQGMHDLLLRLKKYNLPVMIVENGICTQDDSERWNFIYAHLKNVALAMQEGVKVLGYIYWSLLDNYEWEKGFSPRFGIIEVDYNTYKRTIRESAKKFSTVCKTGKLD